MQTLDSPPQSGQSHAAPWHWHKVISRRLIHQQGLIRNIDRWRTTERNQAGSDTELLHGEKLPWLIQGAWIKSHDDKTTHHWRWYETHRWLRRALYQDTPVNVGCGGYGTSRNRKGDWCLSLSRLFFLRDDWNLSRERGRSECILHSDDPLTPGSRKELAVFQRMMDDL